MRLLRHSWPIIIVGLFMWLYSNCGMAFASANSTEEAYTALVTNGENTVKLPLSKGQSKYDPLKEIVLIDKETPYDADMVLLRGTSIKTSRLSDGSIRYELVNAIDIEESESLLDLMQNEIDQNLGANPSQQKILRQIQRLLIKTYSYDKDSVYADGEKENFVKAYYADRQIVCSQYSALVYLLCDRYGIDCKIFYGKRHVFNAIRFEGEQEYTLYDFTGIKSVLTPKVSYLQSAFSSKYHLDQDSEYDMIVKKAINGRIKAHLSWTIVETLICLILIVLSFVVILATKLIRQKIYEKTHPAKARNIRRSSL